MSRFLGQKVGVISGGLSNERAVSLKTGDAVRHQPDGRAMGVIKSSIGLFRGAIARRADAFGADIGGNFALTFALCIIPVFMSAGIALDYSSAYMFR